AVVEDQVAVRLAKRLSAGGWPPVPRRLGRRRRVLVVPDEHARAPADDLARLGEPDLGVGEGLAHGAELDVAVALDAGHAARLRLTVQLFEVDHEGAAEEEDLRAERGPARVGV